MRIGSVVEVHHCWRFRAVVRAVAGSWVKVHGFLFTGREVLLWVPAAHVRG